MNSLPSLSNIMGQDSYFYQKPSVLSVSSLLSPCKTDRFLFEHEEPVKAKRKRASPSQLHTLNRVFQQTRFPSTELRIELGKRLGMSPRTVQIWFQNKRQSTRTREKNYRRPCILSPPTSPSYSHSDKTVFASLPSLRLPPFAFPLTPSSSAYSSPNEFDSFL
ncbi:hypothetical protein G6F56_012513 [Rhizopus delemar]|nr:hypothetical protein G6F56_012513 [Rhizopus delemar]